VGQWRRRGNQGRAIGAKTKGLLRNNRVIAEDPSASRRHGRGSSLCENSPSGILRGIFVSFAGRIARESEISAGGIQTGEIFSMRERRRRVFTQAGSRPTIHGLRGLNSRNPLMVGPSPTMTAWGNGASIAALFCGRS
jgi:hypothetical protein